MKSYTLSNFPSTFPTGNSFLNEHHKFSNDEYFLSSVVVSKKANMLLISKADIITDFIHFTEILNLNFPLNTSHTYNLT